MSKVAILVVLGSLTALAFTTASSSNTAPPVTKSVAKAPDSLSSTSTFYTVRRDMRRCASPLCGGYFIKRVNQAMTRCADGRNQSSCYVANIEWDGQPEVEPQRALLRGTIESRGNRRGTYGILRVSESWQTASDRLPAGDFFRVQDKGLRCITSPCESHHQARLNTEIGREIAGVELNVGAGDATMSEASTAMTSSDGILVAGRHAPVIGPGGRSVKLVASQFYLRAKGSVSAKPCMKTGCSGEICADEEMMSTCVYRSEYECYKKARCERQSNGKCGFTETSELRACLRRRR